MTSESSRQAERLSQTLLRIAAGLGVLLIAVVVNSLLHSDGEALNPVAEAAERTQQMPGARLAIESIYTSPTHPQPIVATGSGVYNARSGRTRVSLKVPTSVTPETVVSVGDEKRVFVHSAPIAAELPPGKPWLGLQPWLGQSKDSAIAGSGGTKDELEMLRAVGDGVESAGEETVRGVSTERYRGSVDLEHLATMLAEEGNSEVAKQYEELAQQMPAPIEVEAWLDARGILRRERMVVDLPTTPGGPTIKMDLRFELFDFGIAPKIHFPDPNEVFDATLLARAELGQLDGASTRHLIRPGAATALTPAEFTSRGNAICRNLNARGKAILRKKTPVLDTLKQAKGNPAALHRAFQTVGLGLYEPLVRLERDALVRLGRLKPPAENGAAYGQLLDQVAFELEILTAETRALEVGDLPIAKHLEDQRKAISDETDAEAKAIGLGDCASSDQSVGSSSIQA